MLKLGPMTLMNSKIRFMSETSFFLHLKYSLCPSIPPSLFPLPSLLLPLSINTMWAN